MVAAPIKLSNPKRELGQWIYKVLNRVYTEGVDRILSLKVGADDVLTCLFNHGPRLFELTYNLPTGDFYYKLADQRKTDAYFDGWSQNTGTRIDRKARRAPSKCGNGVRCGRTCIEATDTCRVKPGIKAIASPGEIETINTLAQQVKEQQQKETDAARAKQPVDELEGKKIRELKKIAQEVRIHRYSHMNTEQLKNAIRISRQDPKQQERVRKTLEEKRSARKFIEEVTPKALINTWKQLEKIAKTAGTSPEGAALLAGAFLMGVAGTAALKIRDRYKTELDESATMAFQRAQNVPIQKTSKNNLMFTVGGFGGIGSTGQRMKDLLGAGDGSAGDKWFSKANEIIPFNHKEFDIPTPSVSKLNSDGKYNPAYLGYVAKQGFGKFLENFKRGRSEAAVDLAASLYAHASKYPKAAINVLGHGVGGNVVREATEILNRMRSPDGKSPAGPSILQRMNIVNLGTPFFGFTNDKFWNNIRNRTITSNQDPFSILPKKAAQWISSVTGHEVDDYLKTNEVRERLREAFGYYSTSLVGGAREEKQRKETFGAIEEALNTAGFGPAAKLWGALGRVVDLSKENPAAASIIGGSILLGTSKLTYSHMQSQYQKNLGTGAKEAQQIAANYNTPNIQKPSAMFVVGGSGAPSASLIEQLQQGADSDPNRKWLLQKNALVGVDPAGLPQMNKGSLSAGGPASLGALAQTVYGSTLGRVLKTGKNNDAIALAAQLHAYGTKDHKPPGKTPARKLNINVLAGSNGGQVAREAVDILKRMEGGADVAKRVQLVTLGTPHFGLASDQMREVNLMGDGDPFEKLPFQRGGGMTQRVNGVGSHDPASYLGNKGVVGKIADAFKGNEPKKAAKSEEMAGISPKLQPFVTSKTAKWRIEALQNSNPENPINRPNFTSLSLDEQRKEIEKYLRNWRLAQLGQAIKEEKDPPEKPPTRSRRKSTKPPES